MKNVFGKTSSAFSIESIRERYTEKNVFVSDMLLAYGGLLEGEKEEKQLKKALDRTWKEAFPGSGELPKEGEPPITETNEEAPQ
jgi:hypothetical protein